MNEWIIVGIIAFLVLIVGAKKLPELARGVGRTKNEFYRGLEVAPRANVPPEVDPPSPVESTPLVDDD